MLETDGFLEKSSRFCNFLVSLFSGLLRVKNSSYLAFTFVDDLLASTCGNSADMRRFTSGSSSSAFSSSTSYSEMKHYIGNENRVRRGVKRCS